MPVKISLLETALYTRCYTYRHHEEHVPLALQHKGLLCVFQGVLLCFASLVACLWHLVTPVQRGGEGHAMQHTSPEIGLWHGAQA